jgi:hypothetical protein
MGVPNNAIVFQYGSNVRDEGFSNELQVSRTEASEEDALPLASLSNNVINMSLERQI